MGDSLKLTHPFPRALSNLKLNWEANTSLPTLDRLKREKILLETSMLSSAKRACFLNKKWLSLFSLSQTCKQIIDSTISHSGHGTNHNFDNETPSHFAAYSLRSPMKRIIKHLRAHWGNSAQQIPGGKIIICFLSTESTRLKTAHLIMSLSSGRVRDASQSYLLDRKHRKKEKKKKEKHPEFAVWMGPAWWQMWQAGGTWHFLLSGFACVHPKCPESGPFSEQAKSPLTT